MRSSTTSVVILTVTVFTIAILTAACQNSRVPARPATQAAQSSPKPPVSTMSYQTWQDPAEGAFTVSLPRGWQVSGGTKRTTRIEPHFVIRAQSPTGGAQLFFDDPRILMREIPNYGTQMMGLREGQTIPAAGGGQLLLARYQPAPQAATEYVRQALCPAASNFQGGLIPGESEDLNREFGAIARAQGNQVHVDAGELSFQCGAQHGYVYAVTLQVATPGQPVSLWMIYRIAGFLASPQENPAASDAIRTMIRSFKMDERWHQAFARECNDVAGNTIRQSNALTQATLNRARQMDALHDQQMANWQRNSNATMNAIEHRGSATATGEDAGHDYNTQLGTKTVCNSTGSCESVNAGVTNWWFDCTGKAYPGTESGDAPSSSLSACWNKGH